ncbi:peptidoglycan DD-metalloendopeptidase family protein [Lysinibacillus sp. CNPSo 3705]|uniref:peptidoglycan DD-metalloendopeptidase family protein n=1 Tax=Lysinibacillus sp. CNPSo 3705 TaxID=3028148 RepID=UPI002363E511|nr:peptidoglycan DD-metalloendopeptidase family protein [Lysinibacillus sp. CNPSo 3705]MDD1505071.1 peptidoglycan DD-metalloendopeptidase family protein [Lysinibacillus sp. CNPSo 3705]
MNHSNNEEQQPTVSQVAKEKIKKASSKQAKKLVKKVAKNAAKVAVKAFAGAIKAIMGFLATVLGPYLLAIVGILLVIIFIFIITTVILSEDDDLGEDAGLVREYAIAAADTTVDPERPEQQKYKIPFQLIIAAVQIYYSEHNNIDIEEAMYDIAEALKPIFTYKTKQGLIETITTVCTDGVCTTTESNDVINVEVLVRVDAWDHIMIGTPEQVVGDWVTETTSSESVSTDDEGNTVRSVTTTTTETRVTTWIANENATEDYTRFENGLFAKPFKMGVEDLKLIEVFYQSTGGRVNYAAWKNGTLTGDYEYSGFGGDVDVTPGSNVPAEFMKYYLGAQQQFGVPWYYLAAFHWVETRFSTAKPMISSVGAEGHMQFMRCTWHGWGYPGCKGTNGHTEMSASDLYNPAIIKKYGGYGIDADGNGKASPWDIADAIYSAAYYLSKNNFSSNPDGAIRKYNHSDSYVALINKKAKEFKDAATVNSNGTGEKPPLNVKNGFIRPTAGGISSPFSARWGTFHYGVDLANDANTPVLAVADGVITAARGGCPLQGKLGSKCGGGWGNYIWLKVSVNGVQYETVYAHLNKILVTEGQKVKQGDTIGLMGTSGSSTGYHLHFELHKGSRLKSNANVLNPVDYVPI